MIKTLKSILPVKLKRFIKPYYGRLIVAEKPKIFCIGRNKTGTTSFKKAMEDLGFVVGNQKIAETFIREYREGNFKPIINYCKTAQVFQDFPFSFPETYKYLDKAYPGSKFILTVRDTPEQWYSSFVSYYSHLWGNGNVPTKADLQNSVYIWEGRPWEAIQLLGVSEDDPYNKEYLIEHYLKYNHEVREYFKNRDNDFLEINLAENDSYQKLMTFLNVTSPFDNFPWKNKTPCIH